MLLTTSSRASLMAATILALGLNGTAAYAKKKSEPVTSEVASPSDSETVVTPLSGEIDPDWGNIRTFWGNIRTFGDGSTGEPIHPFWGNIRTFWGDISPFEGDLNAFWGNIRTFNEDDPDSVTPEWGNIRTFWGDIGEKWGNIRTFWGNIRTFEDAEDLAKQFEDIIDQSEDFWGDAVEAETGKDFEEGFADPLLAKFGIDLDDPKSLARLDEATQQQFFIEWYDGLMGFSGADHVDYWMNQVRWNPAITETLGEGRDSTIGLLDFTVTSADTSRLSFYDGVSDFSNGHGAAVASLMIADHDGKGVMGIAPMANVVAYNPFDETATTNFKDVRDGIVALGQRGASIINMSLGVSGWTLHPEWNDVFSYEKVAVLADNTIFVTAAGNDGITQNKDINWNFAVDPALIVVGSVDPNSEISDFSNRPGDTCLLNAGSCEEGNRLMDRFIVAPGEFILVADGNGGVMRRSGTSFAAPMVSGTIALIHDRWPWLVDYSRESVDIVLQTARDLGDPGTDAVYGVGELDVTAALSPISFDNVRWYEYKNGKLKSRNGNKIRNSKEKKIWEDKGMYFYAFEDIGETFRDFAIPLSSKLVDQTILVKGTSEEQFQAYLYNAMMDWTKHGSSSSSSDGGSSKKKDKKKLSDLPFARNFNSSAVSAMLPNSEGLNIVMSMTPRRVTASNRQNFVPYETSISMADTEGRVAFTMGEGNGAVQLGVTEGMSRPEDYDPRSGGVNPYLGIASGGAFGQFTYALNDRLSISAGITEKTVDYADEGAGRAERETLAELRPFKSSAATFALNYRLTDNIELVGSFTRLNEADSLLGVQSLDPSDFADGSTSDGVTLGATADVGENIRLSVSGTVGRSQSNGGNFNAAGMGLVSTAFQLTMDKAHLFDSKDGMRLSISQPLYLESGSLDVDIVKVIDRQTGELGTVTERFDLAAQKRPLVAEFGYGRSILNDQASVSLFGRAQLQGETSSPEAASLLAGASLNIRY